MQILYMHVQTYTYTYHQLTINANASTAAPRDAHTTCTLYTLLHDLLHNVQYTICSAKYSNIDILNRVATEVEECLSFLFIKNIIYIYNILNSILYIIII